MMRFLAATVATMALLATSAAAQPDKGNGQGKGNGGGNGGGPAAKVERGPAGNGERGGRSAERGPDRASAPQRDRDSGRGEARGNGNDNRGNAFRETGGRADDFRIRGNDGRRGKGRDDGIDIRFVDRGDNFAVFRDFDRRGSIYDGCPPGLAKKYNGCIPPGLARQQPFFAPAFFGYNGFDDTRFYYDDGFLIRLGGDGRISASIPLLGGALAIGNPWPAYYRPVELRPYYRDYYGLAPNGYRYAGNAIYRVDPETAAITSVAALLTGDDFVIGQPAPVGYPVYNVPYAYRDRYSDGPDGYYRYADGYVYRIDPETRLVAAAIELLAS
ncbi:hypothetical protein WAB17_01840 [Parerythrobacter aurantius]|uniref:hypothetical protein n=1 Tax=Parerythrobacter aurantius TaxID=3127706 RepID=UPI003245E9EE